MLRSFIFQWLQTGFVQGFHNTVVRFGPFNGFRDCRLVGPAVKNSMTEANTVLSATGDIKENFYKGTRGAVWACQSAGTNVLNWRNGGDVDR